MRKILVDLFEKRDKTAIIVLLLPLILSIVIRFTLPLSSIIGWNRTFDALMGLLVSIFVAFAISLYIIDHNKCKKNIIQLLKVLFIGMIITFTYNMLVISAFKLSDIDFLNILTMGLLNAIYVLPITLMTVAFAYDRKTAMKIISLTSIYILVLALPYVTLGLKQFYLSFVPSFWLGKYACNFASVYVLWSIGISMIWSTVFWLKYRFDK